MDEDTVECYWNSDTSGISAANLNALPKTTAQLMDATTYGDASWDFVGADRNWKHVDDYDYPKLEWEK